MDTLLDLTFNDEQIWTDVLDSSYEKKINSKLLKRFSEPDYRNELKQQIADHKYKIKPPHEANIPKDDGTLRTVYVNEKEDRVLLAVINNIFFKYCKEMVHNKCMSYQIGIGCGKIDKQISHEIKRLEDNHKFNGYKIDLSKYFDSVKIQYIENVFKQLENKFGKSAILDLVSEYYHDDTLLDKNKQPFQKYTSLRQGCAVAAFLADAVLYDIDEAISSIKNIIYYRYSDDILILGENADLAFEKISKMLEEKSLILNPKKVQKLKENEWFTFLGFSIRNNELTLSKKRLKNLEREIKLRTIDSKSKSKNESVILHRIYQYLYDTSFTPYGYAEGVLPVINNAQDLKMLDEFICDCVRATITGKKSIGGLGYNKTKKNGTIERGKGKNVRTNREKIPTLNYTSISYMQALFNSNRDVYDIYTNDLMYN